MLDMKKSYKHLYAPSPKAVGVVDVPPLNYLMIDGQGDPNTAPEYQQAVAALYGLAYGVRAIRKAAGAPFVVMPLEGLWWWADMDEHTTFTITQADKSAFLWTMMIVLPDVATADMVEAARATVNRKKAVPRLDEVRFETYHEGEAAQIMHVGPYADEGPTVEKLHQYISAQGGTLRGKHHEIYLSDPRKAAPEKMKTIIRQPFAR